MLGRKGEVEVDEEADTTREGGLEGGRCNWEVSRFVGTREGIRKRISLGYARL
jgi:hypothetical protein